MKRNLFLAVIASCFLLGVVAPHIMASSAQADIYDEVEATTSVIAGRYGYAAVTNLSESGHGDVKGTFYYYNTNTGWSAVDSVQVSENHTTETDSYGSTTGSIYFSFKGKIEAVQHWFYGRSNRYGIITVYGLYP